jgi:hypothetical protein
MEENPCSPAVRHERDLLYNHERQYTSLVGELPAGEDEEYTNKIIQYGINSPFEEFAIAHTLNGLGIPVVYIRAIYMTGSIKLEASIDFRKYETHKEFLDSEGNPILQESHNYITIRGYYNGPDHWVAEHEGPLFTPIDLSKALSKGILLAMGNSGSLMKNDSGEPEAIICNFDRIWKVPNSPGITAWNE